MGFKLSKELSGIALCSLWAVSSGCISEKEAPKASDDVSGLTTSTSSNSTTSGAGGAGGAVGVGGAVGTGGHGGNGGAGGGGAPPFTPDCTCLATRAADAPSCTTCCRSCYDEAVLGSCLLQSDACSGDANGCQIFISQAEVCPFDANFASCIETAFAFSEPGTQALAKSLLDCTCGACVLECGSASDECPTP